MNVYHAKQGEGLPMHEHTFKHATVCHAGSCVVRVKGREIVMQPGTQPLDLPARAGEDQQVRSISVTITVIITDMGEQTEGAADCEMKAPIQRQSQK